MGKPLCSFSYLEPTESGECLEMEELQVHIWSWHLKRKKEINLDPERSFDLNPSPKA